MTDNPSRQRQAGANINTLTKQTTQEMGENMNDFNNEETTLIHDVVQRLTNDPDATTWSDYAIDMLSAWCDITGDDIDSYNLGKFAALFIDCVQAVLDDGIALIGDTSAVVRRSLLEDGEWWDEQIVNVGWVDTFAAIEASRKEETPVAA